MTHLTEKQMELILTRNLNLVDSSLLFQSNQYRLKSGRVVDILCRDRADNPVIIETKIYAELSTIRQIIDYEITMLKSINHEYHLIVKKIICCFSCSNSVRKLAGAYGIKVVEFDEKALLKTGSLKSYELSHNQLMIVSLLQAAPYPVSLSFITYACRIFCKRDTKDELKSLSLFIPFEVDIDEYGEPFYFWPKDFNYELTPLMKRYYSDIFN